jgi:hypothetical protein
MRQHAERKRTKISATLAADLVKRVVEYQREAGLSSFSSALEELLWRQVMEERAKTYYLNMSEEERQKQETWAKFSTEQLFKTQ